MVRRKRIKNSLQTCAKHFRRMCVHHFVERRTRMNVSRHRSKNVFSWITASKKTIKRWWISGNVKYKSVANIFSTVSSSQHDWPMAILRYIIISSVNWNSAVNYNRQYLRISPELNWPFTPGHTVHKGHMVEAVCVDDSGMWYVRDGKEHNNQRMNGRGNLFSWFGLTILSIFWFICYNRWSEQHHFSILNNPAAYSNTQSILTSSVSLSSGTEMNGRSPLPCVLCAHRIIRHYANEMNLTYENISGSKHRRPFFLLNVWRSCL